MIEIPLPKIHPRVVFVPVWVGEVGDRAWQDGESSWTSCAHRAPPEGAKLATVMVIDPKLGATLIRD